MPGLVRRLALAALILAAAPSCARGQLPEARVARITPGQGHDGLTWEHAAQMALNRHPDLRQSRETLAAAAHDRNQALGAYLPGIDATAARRRVKDGDSATTNSLALDLDVTQPIFTGFETTGDALQAWRSWEAARWSYVETSASVRQNLRSSFVELLRLYKLLDVNRSIAARRKENADLIRLRYEAGREHEGSLRRAEAIAEQAAFEVRQTERRIDSQSLDLGRELGGDFRAPMPVAGDLEALAPASPESPADYPALAERTPTVLRLMRRAEASKAAVLSSQSSLWPTVEGTYNVGSSGSGAGSLDNDGSTVGLQVSVPIFHGGQNVQGVLEANAAYKAAAEAARSARDLRIADLSERWAAFRDAWELVAVRRAFRDAARQRSEIVHAQYTSGLADFQDFDIAEQELADAETAYVQSLADVLTREADWMAIQGRTLEEVVDAR